MWTRPICFEVRNTGHYVTNVPQSFFDLQLSDHHSWLARREISVNYDAFMGHRFFSPPLSPIWSARVVRLWMRIVRRGLSPVRYIACPDSFVRVPERDRDRDICFVWEDLWRELQDLWGSEVLILSVRWWPIRAYVHTSHDRVRVCFSLAGRNNTGCGYWNGIAGGWGG